MISRLRNWRRRRRHGAITITTMTTLLKLLNPSQASSLLRAVGANNTARYGICCPRTTPANDGGIECSLFDCGDEDDAGDIYLIF